ncbi:hypothetical protein LPJ75_001557, partial [Coemansia sp. RSA 2598]
MHTSIAITFSEKQAAEPCLFKKPEPEAEPPTRLNIALLVKVCIATVLLYCGLVYFYQLPKLRHLIRTSGPFTVNECQFIQGPTSTPISPTTVQIDWVTSCRSDATVISYKPATNTWPSPKYHRNAKYSLGALVSSGISSSSFHYRATVYVEKGSEIRYKLHTGIDALDRLPAAR